MRERLHNWGVFTITKPVRSASRIQDPETSIFHHSTIPPFHYSIIPAFCYLHFASEPPRKRQMHPKVRYGLQSRIINTHGQVSPELHTQFIRPRKIDLRPEINNCLR